MISSETPDKLANIIRDTWPNLYRPPKIEYDKINRFAKEETLNHGRTTT